MADDWTDVPYNHIKDWSPIPDPKQFESDDGLLSSLYNLPNTIKRKLDTLFPTGSAQEDIKGLINKSRIEAIGTPNAAQIQANDPTWKKATRTGVDVLANVAKGQFGVQPNPDESPIAKFANKIAQPNRESDPYLTSLNEQSGLPDEQLMGGIPFKELNEGKPVFHATTKDIKTFDPLHVGEGEFGKMMHFSESPTYADEYSRGWYSGGPEGMEYAKRKEARPNIIPGIPDAKNILDLEAHISPEDEAIISKAFGTDQWSINMLKDALEDPEFAKKLPFDAYRYNAHGVMNLAIPHGTSIKTPWGTPLTD